MLRTIKSKALAVAALAGAAAAPVMAAVPAAVTTAMNDMRDDGLAVATAFLIASILLTAFLFMRKGAR